MAVETTETYALLCYSHSSKAWYLDSVGWSDEGTAGMQYVRCVGPGVPFLITEDWRARALLNVLNITKAELTKPTPEESLLHSMHNHPPNIAGPPPREDGQTDPSYWR